VVYEIKGVEKRSVIKLKVQSEFRTQSALTRHHAVVTLCST
jgi:hypothetical protein